MKAFLILMVSISFITAILSSSRDSEWGYTDDGDEKLSQ